MGNPKLRNLPMPFVSRASGLRPSTERQLNSRHLKGMDFSLGLVENTKRNIPEISKLPCKRQWCKHKSTILKYNFKQIALICLNSKAFNYVNNITNICQEKIFHPIKEPTLSHWYTLIRSNSKTIWGSRKYEDRNTEVICYSKISFTVTLRVLTQKFPLA